ncbi:MAG TPA: hypothetical protein PKL73_10310 [Polyangiaceae bacterium]|jgi:hypothetical protein|nr:MAG: hypothetical protein BWY17_00553 [Deltaproteobacteria bacterium ADurb.Bin207]HNS97332.1 hypothetical protein [Polyangiaceae bacterium]HNZ23415.1 hypothetical protein [Polyangiaceae bacterium]HOD25164.1 hypothetical protein [Polyangiaceae bacterium]HOE51568.1 hypothetical protein [Polyangiaceae bacterium]
MQSRGGTTSEALWVGLRELRRTWPGGGWSWDARLSCVACSFAVEIVEEAKAAALKALPHAWNEKTLVKAPSHIRQLAETTGGVRADQLLLARQSVEGLLTYGLWWPWRNEVTISFRIGMSGIASPRDEMELMEMFGAYL